MPYRTNAELATTGPRWGVTRWQRWYVKIARVFWQLRQPYAYQREYNQYLRDLNEWQEKWGSYNKYNVRWHNTPPMPVPPPIYVLE